MYGARTRLACAECATSREETTDRWGRAYLPDDEDEVIISQIESTKKTWKGTQRDLKQIQIKTELSKEWGT